MAAVAEREIASRRLRRLDAVPFILPALLGLAWAVASYTGRLPAYLLPSPGRLLLSAADFVLGRWHLTSYSGTFWRHALASTERVVMGFSLAAVIGIPLGLAAGWSKTVSRVVDLTIHSIRAVPGIGWLPIAMVWFGIGTRTTVFLIALAAFFPVYVNSVLGTRSVRQVWVRAARMLGASRMDIFRTVVLPAALPAICDGLRLALGLSWAYLVLGELTGVPDGLGAVMMDARMMGRVEIILVAMLSIAILGRLSDLLLVAALHRAFPVLRSHPAH